MKRIAIISLVFMLGGCALNPVMEPYRVQKANSTPNDEVATIWGEYSPLNGVMFREANKQSLPTRMGGGYPISLQLPAGKHEVELLYWSNGYNSNRATEQFSVESGHTYTISAKTLTLVDLGTEVVCHFERKTELYGGATDLICEKK